MRTCASAQVAIDALLELFQSHFLPMILAALDVGIDGHYKARRAEPALAGMMPGELFCRQAGGLRPGVIA